MDLTHPEERPLVTFLLFAYNQEKYIKEAVEGALTQTYEPLEIILSDDGSTDRTFEIMQELAADYTGPHRIVLNRSSRNLGLAAHINHVMTLVNGELVVAAAGDDVSLPDRTAELVQKWLSLGKISGSIYSHFRTIDADGFRQAPLARDKERTVGLRDRQLAMLNNFSGISGCTHAWTKDLFNCFGPIDDRIQHEDVTIPLRALLKGAIIFIPLDLVDYRLTQGSITRKTFNSFQERIQKMERYWTGRLALFAQFDKDVEVARASGWANADDLDWLSGEVAKGKSCAQQQCQLYAGSAKERLLTAINPIVSLPIKERIKWLVIALMPWCYGNPLLMNWLCKLKYRVARIY